MSLFVAGAIFGEVGVPVFVACAPFGAISGDSRSAKYCFSRTKRIAKMGRVKSAKGQVRDDEFILGTYNFAAGAVFGDVAARRQLDVSCVATIKPECPTSIVAL